MRRSEPPGPPLAGPRERRVARPTAASSPEGPSAERIFQSFVARAYGDASPSEAKWAAQIEDALEADPEAATDGRAPVFRDTDVAPSPATGAPPIAARPRFASPNDDEALADDPAPDEQGTLRVVLLTRRKTGAPPPGDATDAARDDGPVPEVPGPPRPPSAISAPPGKPPTEWASETRAPSTSTQKREALRLVPEVAKVEPPAAPPPEGSEDGLIPPGELDRRMSDMAVLLRYGHPQQVRDTLDALLAQFPRDLLLARRIAEFWVAQGHTQPAKDVLFTLASGLFERRNVEGMRQALEQVLVLDEDDERAQRLLSLLDQRPPDGRAPVSGG